MVLEIDFQNHIFKQVPEGVPGGPQLNAQIVGNQMDLHRSTLATQLQLKNCQTSALLNLPEVYTIRKSH